MRIMLLVTGLGVGGAERQVVDLADAFVNAGHDVLLVSLGGDIALRPADGRVAVRSLGMTRTPAGVARAARTLRETIRSWRPAVVHSHLVHANLFARIMRLLVPMPILISSAHNTDEEGWWRMAGYRLTNSLADLSTNVSARAVKAFEAALAVPSGQMRAVYNGVSVDRFRFDPAARSRVRGALGMADDQKLLLAVGRLAPPKDYPNLLRALALLGERTSLSDVRLVIAGDGPLLKTLRSLVCELELDSQVVTFLGARDDVPNLMSAADVFVLPSAREGFGLVVAEAMACERPVVATDCGGVSEVLGDCGWLVRPRAPDELAAALALALELTPADVRRMGQAARARVVSAYAIEGAARTWLGIYAQLADRRSMRKGRAR